MTSTVHARAPVLKNVPLARDTWLVRFLCPEMARAISGE